MKKCVFFIPCFLFLLVFLLFPKERRIRNQEIDYELIQKDDMYYIYYEVNGLLVGIPFDILSENYYERITDVFEYLTNKSNVLPEDCQTMVNPSTTLLSYEIYGNDIYLSISDDFYRMEEKNYPFALGQILLSYQALGFSDVYLMQDGVLINQLGNNILVNGIQDNLWLNYTIETLEKETKTIRVEYNYKNGRKTFRNYVVSLNEDEISFAIEKLLTFYKRDTNEDLKLLAVIKEKDKLIVELEGEIKECQRLKNLICQNLGLELNSVFISKK